MSKLKISVIAPVKNEVDFIGYSVMAALPYVHEFIYALTPSTDGTGELLTHLKAKHPQITVIPFPEFDPHDMAEYNRAFNVCIDAAQGDACWFLHPDMIVTQFRENSLDPLAFFTRVKSFAGDFGTEIVSGRGDKWKNIHAKRFGLHYFGGYGSQNEDFYHRDITGTSYEHHGDRFDRYPFEVVDSGIHVNHYCELRSYRRRLEKMKLCLKTQHPGYKDDYIEELAARHPRVTLEDSSQSFGRFRFAPTAEAIPGVFTKYKEEFEQFKKEAVSNG